MQRIGMVRARGFAGKYRVVCESGAGSWGVCGGRGMDAGVGVVGAFRWLTVI